jgi:putative endonuclease
MSPRDARAAGQEEEEIAMEHLRSQGLEILETNYRYERGEVDIVAQEGEVLVFCEVKLRKSDAYGPPEYAVTRRKQAQIRRVALGYLADHNIRDTACRFDVVAIERKGSRMDIRHMRNAF